MWERTRDGTPEAGGSGASPPGLPSRRTLRVLVVHPDRDLLARVERMLARGPYRVCAVPGPGQAIALARLFELDVALVGPGEGDPDGRTMVRVLRRARPSLRCIRMSGSDEPDAAGSLPGEFHGLLRPPLDAESLRAAVAAVLAA